MPGQDKSCWSNNLLRMVKKSESVASVDDESEYAFSLLSFDMSIPVNSLWSTCVPPSLSSVCPLML